MAYAVAHSLPCQAMPQKSALILLTARLSSRDFNKASRLALGCWIVLLSPLTIDYASISSTSAAAAGASRRT